MLWEVMVRSEFKFFGAGRFFRSNPKDPCIQIDIL